MRRLTTLLALLLLTISVGAENLRGPLAGELTITPTQGAEASGIGLEAIVTVEIDGDPRFLDAIDLELTAPAAVGDYAGALTVSILGPIRMEQRAGVAEVVGEPVLERSLLRGGKSFYQIVLREDADPDASPAVSRPERVVSADAFPIALSIVPQMKGLAESLQNAEFSIGIRPVTRDIGAVRVRYVREDGSAYEPEGALAPDFELQLDDQPVQVQEEYLLEPGLHRFRLRSERYQDQEITVGVDRGTTTRLELPLELAVATVSYSAPRGSTVYVDGEILAGATGDFTVPPGEHTIVVVLGDYTVTRRFTVAEQQTYSMSVVMDIVIEEIK